MKKSTLVILLIMSLSAGCGSENPTESGGTPAPPETVAAPEPAPEPVALEHAVDPTTLALMIDPVCKMSFEEYAVETTAEHGGKSYGFCSEFCKKNFAKDPDKILARLTESPSTP